MENTLRVGAIINKVSLTKSSAIFLGTDNNNPMSQFGFVMYKYAYLYEEIPINRNKDFFLYLERLNLYVDYVDNMIESVAPKEITGYLTENELSEIQNAQNVFWNKVKEENIRLKTKYNDKKKKFSEIDATTYKKMQEIYSVWDRDWLLCFIDNRYTKQDKAESRLVISYEINTTKPRTGFLAPTEQKTDFVFGLHNVYIEKNMCINLVDSWIDAYPAPETDDISQIRLAALSCLSSISNEEYFKLVSDSMSKGGNKLFIAKKEATILDYKICTNWG
jgi:hypothetical protein